MNTQLSANVLIAATLLIVIYHVAALPYFPDSSFLYAADSLFALENDSQETMLSVVKDRHKYYMVTTCKTILSSAVSLIDALQNIDSYDRYFGFIKESGFVPGEDDSIALFEAGVLWYRAYYFGEISEAYSADSTVCILRCGNANQKKCRKTWRKEIGGLIKIGFHDMDIFWKIEDKGDGKSRISLTTSQAPAVWIPQWLMEIGAKKIFPGMLRDIESYLVQQNQMKLSK